MKLIVRTMSPIFFVILGCSTTEVSDRAPSAPIRSLVSELDACILAPGDEERGISGYWKFYGAEFVRSINVAPSLHQTQGCDIAIQFIKKTGVFTNSYRVFSAYSKRLLFPISASFVNGGDSEVKNAFRTINQELNSNMELYEQVVMERKEYLQRQEQSKPIAGGGLSKGDLKEIVKAAVEGASQAQKKEPEAKALIVSDVDKPTYQSPENPNNFAVVIGIEKYSEVPEAQFAERDAETVKNHLSALGYPRRNIVHLSGEKAGRAAIEKFVETWLPRNVNEHSRVFFYFSGHGAPDVETKQAYLVPWDGDPKFLENTAYPVKRLYEKLNSLPAKEVVVALDTCFSGLGGRSVVPKGSRPMGLSIESPLAAIGRLVVFTASANDEISGSEDTQGHGLFTYYFLKGLNGATKESGGHVTVKGLHNFLSPEVQNEARRQNRSQTPQLLPPHAGNLATLILR